MRLDTPLVGRIALLLAGFAVGAGVVATAAIAITEATRGDAPADALGAPHFVEESAQAGIDHMYAGEFEFFVGGGVAVFDCNRDLLPDLYIAGGAGPAGLYVNHSQPGGSLRFERLLSPITDLESVTGAFPIDVDSDGAIDLAVLRRGKNVMLEGTADCEFALANETWEIEGGEGWTVAFSALWEGDNALPTLAFGNYLELDHQPGDRECAEHQLIRPNNGTAYAAPMDLAPGWCTLSILFSDWSGHGDRDLRMANDRHYYTDGGEQLWRIEEGEPPVPYTDEDGWQTMQIWGMGIASHDLTGDGAPEVFLTSQGDNKLQTLTGDAGPAYEDIALSSGVTAHRPFLGDTNRPSTAWHAEFGDVNNDGFIDLYVTKGNVDSMPEFAADDPNNLLIGQPDGRFVEGAADAGIVDYSITRGGALADFNLDGLLDVVAIERREAVKVWRNTGPAGNWVSVALSQPGPNIHSVGSWIEVDVGSETIHDEVTIGGGHAGGELGPRHVGLGEAERARIRVVWPDGAVSSWHQVDAGQVVQIDRETDSLTSVFAADN